MATARPGDPIDGIEPTDGQPDGTSASPGAGGSSRPVDDALATFASTLAALSEPATDQPFTSSLPRSSRTGASTPPSGRSIDDLLSGFQSTLASLPGESGSAVGEKPAPKPSTPRSTTRRTSTTAKAAAGTAAPSPADMPASTPSWRDRLAAASAAIDAAKPAPEPTPAPDLPEFLRSRSTTRGKAATKEPTPAPTTTGSTGSTPSWRERLDAASANAAAPIPAAELPEFLRPRAKAGATTPVKASATDRLAKLLADAKTETKADAAAVVEAPAVVPEEPETVAQAEPVATVVPQVDLESDLPLAADLSVPQPVEPVPSEPVRRRPSIRRQVKATPVVKPEEATPVVPAEPAEAAEIAPVDELESAAVEPEVAAAEPEVAAAEPEVVDPTVELEPVQEPVLDEPVAVAEETEAAAPVAEPKPRGRRKSKAVPVLAEEAAPEEAATEQAVESDSAETAGSDGGDKVAVAAAAGVAATAVAADKAPEAYAVTEPSDGSWWDEQPGDAAAEDGEPEETAAKPKRKWSRSSILLLLLAILLVVGAAVTGGIYWYKEAHTVTFLDMNGNKVIPDDSSITDPAYVQAADAQPDIGQRFKMPSVNLDVPLGSVNQVGGLINPPGFTSVYWVKNMGVSLANADKGTVYVVTHAVKAPGEAPGDYFIDQSSTSIIVKPGAEVDVGDRKYTVTSSMVVSKNELGSQTSLWAGTPGMLVLITCMQGGEYLANGHSADNVVIIGTLVS